MTDWAVWPIFILQLITFLFALRSRDKRFAGVRLKTWAILMIIVVNLLIVISLYHDSTQVLKLYF